jgi:hypothetical protein
MRLIWLRGIDPVARAQSLRVSLRPRISPMGCTPPSPTANTETPSRPRPRPLPSVNASLSYSFYYSCVSVSVCSLRQSILLPPTMLAILIMLIILIIPVIFTILGSVPSSMLIACLRLSSIPAKTNPHTSFRILTSTPSGPPSPSTRPARLSHDTHSFLGRHKSRIQTTPLAPYRRIPGYPSTCGPLASSAGQSSRPGPGSP